MIAVVGATGNTGRAVVRELVQLGLKPICLVEMPKGRPLFWARGLP